MADDAAGPHYSRSLLRPPRFCDVCIADHASLYCAADDAYLCTSCDTDVHNANPLAQRHERVRLGSNGAPVKMERRGGSAVIGTGSLDAPKSKNEESNTTVISASSGSWGRASKKRSKIKKRQGQSNGTQAITSSISNNSNKSEGIVMPDNSCMSSDIEAGSYLKHGYNKALQPEPTPASSQFQVPDHPEPQNDYQLLEEDQLLWNQSCQGVRGLSDIEESLQRFDEYTTLEFQSFNEMNLEGLDVDARTLQLSSVSSVDHSLGVAKDVTPELPMAVTELQDQNQSLIHIDADGDFEVADADIRNSGALEGYQEKGLSGYPLLRLNYLEVITEWADRGPVWLEGDKKMASNFEDPLTMGDGSLPRERKEAGGSDTRASGMAENASAAENRQARVMRYREKRRNRLFSKKVRYEVRKINAERRPRVKGRFVKREDAIA